MKKQIAWQAVLIAVVVSACAAWIGWRWRTDPLGPINLGLDLRGGVHILLECLPTKETPVNEENVRGVITVMRNRLDPEGVREIAIQRQGARWVNIEIPGERDPEKVERLIGERGVLEFVDTRGKSYEQGDELPADRRVLFTGKELKAASAGFDNLGRPAVNFELKRRGAELFETFTKRNLEKYLAIVLDGRVISCPRIKSVIFGGTGIIEGSFSREEIQELVAILNAGRLPLEVRIAQKDAVSPTLGADSIRRSLHAGVVGVCLVLAFMIAYYRLPGVVADVALMFYVLLLFGLLSMFNATLTLPGIAGFILSIGMAVDANILIIERMREELRWGKTLKAGLEAGFSRAFTAILDSNVTTLIATAVLYALGTGPIRGFAVTLSLGILVSMFSAIMISRVLFAVVTSMRGAQSLSLYGVKQRAGRSSEGVRAPG
ncbi:MAG: protein translocase subunit SecD [bacterium]